MNEQITNEILELWNKQEFVKADELAIDNGIEIRIVNGKIFLKPFFESVSIESVNKQIDKVFP